MLLHETNSEMYSWDVVMQGTTHRNHNIKKENNRDKEIGIIGGSNYSGLELLLDIDR